MKPLLELSFIYMQGQQEQKVSGSKRNKNIKNKDTFHAYNNGKMEELWIFLEF